jgi:hypothetical protein
LALIGFVISVFSPQSPVLSLFDKITYSDLAGFEIGFVLFFLHPQITDKK